MEQQRIQKRFVRMDGFVLCHIYSGKSQKYTSPVYNSRDTVKMLVYDKQKSKQKREANTYKDVRTGFSTMDGWTSG